MRYLSTMCYRLNALGNVTLSTSKLIKENASYILNYRKLCKSNDICNYEHLPLTSTKWFSTTAIGMKERKTKSKSALNVPPKLSNDISSAFEIEKFTADYEKALETLKDNFIRHVSLRTTTGALEQIKIKYDGENYALQELVQIHRKPKLVVLNASDFPNAIKEIINALRKNHMNLNPSIEGCLINVPIPTVTREYKENLLKSAKVYVNKYRDATNDIRNKYIKVLKQDIHGKELYYKVETYIDDFNKHYVAKGEEMLKAKEKEFLDQS